MSISAPVREDRPTQRGFAGLELWRVDLQAAGPALREIEDRTPRLSHSDRHDLAAFTDAHIASERHAAHVALRLVLERAAGAQWRGVAFTRTAHGKPHLQGAPAVFSLSHAPGLALIAVGSSGIVGVDVERARPVRIRAPRRGHIEDSARALNRKQALPDEEGARFLQAWVRLEAFAKAQGCGVGRLLTRFGIMGGGGAASGDILQRVEQARAEMPGVALSDLALGDGLFGALAVGPARPAPAISRLPESIGGLERLVERDA